MRNLCGFLRSFGAVRESGCSCCGEIAGTDVDCRVFEYEGRNDEVPTREMVANAICRCMNTQPDGRCGSDALPENLRRFYGGRAKKSEPNPVCGCDCACGG